MFDWDGTLIDSVAKIIATMATVTDELDLPRLPRQRVKDIIGLALPEAVARLFPNQAPSFHGQVVRRYRYHFLREDAPLSPLFPGVLTTLRELQGANYLLAVATGKSRRGLERELDRTGLRGHFIATRCADETRSKPDPQMLKEIMAEVAIEPHETVMVGDSQYDLDMASNAGADAVAVTYGVHDRDRLLACAPRACFDFIAELGPWLTGMSQPPREV